MKTAINFENNTWTCNWGEFIYNGTFQYRPATKSVQIDWNCNRPNGWHLIENDIYLEVIANY